MPFASYVIVLKYQEYFDYKIKHMMKPRGRNLGSDNFLLL